MLYTVKNTQTCGMITEHLPDDEPALTHTEHLLGFAPLATAMAWPMEMIPRDDDTISSIVDCLELARALTPPPSPRMSIRCLDAAEAYSRGPYIGDMTAFHTGTLPRLTSPIPLTFPPRMINHVSHWTLPCIHSTVYNVLLPPLELSVSPATMLVQLDRYGMSGYRAIFTPSIDVD